MFGTVRGREAIEVHPGEARDTDDVVQRAVAAKKQVKLGESRKSGHFLNRAS